MDQRRSEDQDRPNQNANNEPAEGSRETIRENERQDEGQQGGGITNRPLAEEQQEQDEVPPRGQTKDEERHEG